MLDFIEQHTTLLLDLVDVLILALFFLENRRLRKQNENLLRTRMTGDEAVRCFLHMGLLTPEQVYDWHLLENAEKAVFDKDV